jgi:hypothetical protein
VATPSGKPSKGESAREGGMSCGWVSLSNSDNAKSYCDDIQ